MSIAAFRRVIFKNMSRGWNFNSRRYDFQQNRRWHDSNTWIWDGDATKSDALRNESEDCSSQPRSKRSLSPCDVSTPKKHRTEKSSEIDRKDTKKSSADNHQGSSLLVSFDLELTDGSFASEIFQVGAKCKTSSFSKNILPEGKIDWGVTKYATNITVKQNGEGISRLFDVKTNEYVPSVGAKEGLNDFLNWLNEQKEEGCCKDVVLIAQGDTDMPALINNMARADLMSNLTETVDSFADSLKYFQNNFKNWNKFRIPIIYAKIFPERSGFKAHSAIDDATALHDILEELNKEKDEKEFVDKIKQQSQNTNICVQLAKNRINKTLAKSKNKPQIHGVKKFLAIQ